MVIMMVEIVRLKSGAYLFLLDYPVNYRSMSDKEIPFPKALLHPKHWGSWIVAGLLWLLVKGLPYSWLMKLGSGLGWAMEKLMPYRMLVARTNIELCFSNKTQPHWQTVYRRHVSSVGKGLLEMAMGWFLSPNHFNGRVRHEGYEAVDQALASGRGVLFLGVHTTGLDFGAPLLNNRYSTYFMYRPANNPVLDYIVRRGRLRNCPGVIDRKNMRELLSRLKKGECVWYGSDQDFGGNTTSVFVPFYGVQAYTLPYYAKLAQKTGAAVIPVTGFRDEKKGEFLVRYLPEIVVDNMTDEQAALAMNQAIEQLLLGYEDQYYWVHRRFKTRPEGEADVYPKKPSHIRREKRQAKQRTKP